MKLIMSKSILVIETPNDCEECPLYTEIVDEYTPYCAGNADDIDEFIQNHSKPDWCPLKEISTKKEKIEYCGNGVLGINIMSKARFNEGYNTCVDEILKERD